MMTNQKETKNWLEWTVTIMAAIIVLFTLTFLVYQVLFQEQTQPDIKVVLGNPQKLENYYAIPVKAENRGTETAQKVRIEIFIENSSEDEKAHIEFDYLPGKSTSRGWVSFRHNPTGKNLKTHVLGYNSP